MSVSNFLRGSPYSDYDVIKTDLNAFDYVDSSGNPLYPNGVTYIAGDVVLTNGTFRGNIGPLLNDTGATVNTVTAGNALLPNLLNADYIYTDAISNTAANMSVTGNTVTFKKGATGANQNVHITGNLTVDGTITGTTANSGTVTLVAGTATVGGLGGTIVLTASSMILMSRGTAGGVIGQLSISSMTPGAAGTAAFTIQSIDPSRTVVNDTSVVNYYIVTHA